MRDPIRDDCPGHSVSTKSRSLWRRGRAHALLVAEDGIDWAPSQTTLDGWNVSVQIAASCEEAIHQIRATRPDMVLAASRPESATIFKQIREQWPEENVALLLLGPDNNPTNRAFPIETSVYSEHLTSGDYERVRHALESRGLWLALQDRDLRIQTLVEQSVQESQQLTDLFLYAQRSLEQAATAPTDTDSYAIMMATFMLSRGMKDTVRPTQILITRRDKKGRHSGFLYSRDGANVRRHPGPFALTPKRASTVFGDDEKPQREATSEMESALKSPFGPALRRAIGTLNNYVAICVDDWGLVAINMQHPASINTVLMLQGCLQHTQTLTAIADRTEVETRHTRSALEALTRAALTGQHHCDPHDRRINEITRLVAEAMGCSTVFVSKIYAVAHMHNVGYAALPEAILNKPGSLTAKEWEVVRTHPLLGAHLIGDDPTMTMAREIALCHHERFDGSGYPYGLEGEEIPLAGRIAAAVSVYDALRSQRPHRESRTHKEAMNILLRGDEHIAPAHFDPNVLAIFRVREQDVADIYDGVAESHLDNLSDVAIHAMA